MNIEHNANESWTAWQNEDIDGLITSEAILIEKFDVDRLICLAQNGNRVSIGYDSIDDLCKHLKAIMKK